MGNEDEYTGLEQYVNNLVQDTLRCFLPHAEHFVLFVHVFSSYLPVGACTEMQLKAAGGPKKKDGGVAADVSKAIAPLVSGAAAIRKELGSQNSVITNRLSNLEGSMEQVCNALRVLAPAAFETGAKGEE